MPTERMPTMEKAISLLRNAKERCEMELTVKCRTVDEAEKQQSCEAAAIWIAQALWLLGEND